MWSKYSVAFMRLIVPNLFFPVFLFKMDSLIQTVKDNNLKLTLSFGIALHHAGLHERDRKIAEELFVNQKVQVNSRFLYLFTYIFLYLTNQYKHGLYNEVQNYGEPWGVRGKCKKPDSLSIMPS